MLKISREAKNAVKIALSLTIAFGISFYQNWENPYWAAFAIIFTNHSALGQSVGKAVQRLAGTLVATVFAFLIMGLFVHDQWLFMIALSVYLLIFSYLSTGKKLPNFFKVTAFVCVVLCISNSMNSGNTFHAATLRILQTGMGIAIATVVNLLVWPEVSSKRLISLTSSLLENIRGQFVRNCDWIIEKKKYADKDRLHVKSRNMLIEFSEVLAGSTIDTPELMVRKDKWRYFEKTLTSLCNEIDILRESRRKLDDIEVGEIFINIADVNNVIHKRLDYLIKRCTEHIFCSGVRTVIIKVEQQELEKLSALDRSTIEIIRRRINNISRLCGDLVECVGLPRKKYVLRKRYRARYFLVIDRERLIPAVRVVMTLWATFLIWKYVRIPGSTGFITMGTSFALGFLTSPKTPVTSIIKPSAISCICAAFAYVFIIPHLSSYSSLGIIIFLYSFAVAYVFRKPQQTMSKLFCLAMTFAIVSITNPQQHVFLSIISKSAMFGIILLLLIVMSSLPESMYPGNVVFRLLNVYWKNIGIYFRYISRERKLGLAEHWRKSVPESRLRYIPDKLTDWIAAINRKRFPEIDNDDLNEISDIVRALSIHTGMAELLTVLTARSELASLLDSEFVLYREKISTVFPVFSGYRISHADALYKEILHYQREANSRIENIISSRQHDSVSQKKELSRIYLLLGHYNAIITTIQRYLILMQRVDLTVLREFRI